MKIRQVDYAQRTGTPRTALDIEKLWNQQELRLKKFIRKKVSHREDSEDLMQMTFLEAFRSRHNFRGASKPETWLFGIAVNLIRNHYKTMARHAELGDMEIDLMTESYMTDDPSIQVEYRNMLHKAMAAIERFPRETRFMLYQVVDSGQSYQEVAQELAMPIGTVRSRLSRARAQLKLHMG